MGIGEGDMVVLDRLRKDYPTGGKCAVLGDCTFFFNGGSKEAFRDRLKFDSVETFDINGTPDHKLDLQEELGPEFKGKYDWIVDAGTLFCIFDVPSAWKNLLYMLKDDGKIWHQSNLVGHFGRSFWAFSPSVFGEFYSANGFEVKEMGYMIKSNGRYSWTNCPTNHYYLQSATQDSFQFSPNTSTYQGPVVCDTNLMCFAIRKESKKYERPVPEHYIRTNGR